MSSAPPSPHGDPELDRRNMRLGWALAALFVVLFLGTFAVALVYLQFD